MNTSIPQKFCRVCGIELTSETGSLKHPGQYRLDCKKCRNAQWQAEHPSSKKHAGDFCVSCGIPYSPDAFTDKKPGNHRPECDACWNKHRREMRAANPERFRAYDNADYAKNADKINAERMQKRREQGIPPAHRNPMPEGYTGSRKDWYYETHPGTYEKHQDYLSQLKHKRRAQGYGAGIDVVDYAYIRQRDGMFCYLCQQAILSHQKKNYDHVIPLSRGGMHTEDNIKITHEICNQRKHNKLVSELTEHDKRGP